MHGRQPIGRRPVADLAMSVLAPAVGGISRRDQAGVTTAAAQYENGEAARGQSLHRLGRRAIGCGSVADLTASVTSPAVRRGPAGDTACRRVTRAHRHELEPAADRDRACFIDCSLIAELAAAVVAPAVGRAIGRDAAAV